MTAIAPRSDDPTRWPPRLDRNPWLPVAFVAVFSLWVRVSNLPFDWLVGSNPTVTTEALWSVPSGVAQVALVLVVLRYEGVQPGALGVGRRELVLALLSVTGFLVALNVAVAGLVVLGGGQLSLEPFGLYRSPPFDYSVPALVATGVAQYLFVGPVEELGFRGYLQNKLTAIFGTTAPRLRVATAIVLAAVGFSLLHVPTLVLVDGVQLGQAAGTLALLTLSGVTFGTIYALTHNLLLVAFLHGIGNLWPLFVDPGAGAWPNWGLILGLYALVVLLYRQRTIV